MNKPDDFKQGSLDYCRTAHIGLQTDTRPCNVKCKQDAKGVPPAPRKPVTKAGLCTMMLLALDK